MRADDAPLRAKSGKRRIPVKIPLQDFVLLNVAHEKQPTSTANGLGAFRILGIFESSEHLIQHATTKLGSLTTKMEGHPTHTYKLIPRAPLDPEVELEQIQALYSTNQEKAAEAKVAFEEYCNARAAREVDEYEQLELLRTEKQKRKERAEMLMNNSDTPISPPDDIPVILGQRYAAVGLVMDGSSRLEHAVCVYAAFESEEKCQRYLEDTLTDVVRDIPLFVVDMYRWVYPDVVMSSLGDDIPTGYRHEELHQIMTAHDEERRMREVLKDKIDVTEICPEESTEHVKEAQEAQEAEEAQDENLEQEPAKEKAD